MFHAPNKSRKIILFIWTFCKYGFVNFCHFNSESGIQVTVWQYIFALSENELLSLSAIFICFENTLTKLKT